MSAGQDASSSKFLVIVEQPSPSVPVKLDGKEIVEGKARALFDAFRETEARLQAYINKFPEPSRERYRLISRYRGQLKRWLADWKREACKRS